MILKLGRIPTREEFMAKAVEEAKNSALAVAGNPRRLASGRGRLLPLPATGNVTGRAVRAVRESGTYS